MSQARSRDIYSGVEALSVRHAAPDSPSSPESSPATRVAITARTLLRTGVCTDKRWREYSCGAGTPPDPIRATWQPCRQVLQWRLWQWGALPPDTARTWPSSEKMPGFFHGKPVACTERQPGWQLESPRWQHLWDVLNRVLFRIGRQPRSPVCRRLSSSTF